MNMKRKLKQWWSTIPVISTNSDLKSLNIKKTTINDTRN